MIDRTLAAYGLVSTTAAAMLFDVSFSMSPSDGTAFWVMTACGALIAINSLVVWVFLLLRSHDTT